MSFRYNTFFNYFIVLIFQNFLCGECISLADLISVCEFSSLLAADQDISQSGRPSLTRWMERVKEKLQPHFDDAHQDIAKLRELYLERQA